MSTTPERHTQAPQPDLNTRNKRAWSLVATREVQVRVTDRNFLIGTAVTVVLVLGIMLLQGFLAGREDTSTIAVTDDAGEQVIASIAEMNSGLEMGSTTYEAERVEDTAAAESLVMDGDADAMLTQEDGQWQLGADGSAGMSLQQMLRSAVEQQVLASNAAEAGTSPSELLQGSQLVVNDVSGGETNDGAETFIVGLAFAFVFYMAAIMFGMSIATSVVEEKQSRIVEILTAAIPVTHLLTGKIVGQTLLALGQVVLIAASALVGITFTDFDVMLPGMSAAIIWYIPFFIAGFLALACVWAANGAMASRNEDLQSTTTPITLALVAIFVTGVNLDGTAEQIGSFVPVMSTLLMPVRILEGGVAWWEPAVALILVLIFAAFTMRVGSRIYRRALLHTSGPLGWRAAWKRAT